MEKIYFVTNRNPNRKSNPSKFGNDFNSDGFGCIRYGYAEVSGDNNNNITLKVADENLKLNKEQVSLDETSLLGSQTWMKHLQKEMLNSSKDIVIYVHGYNVSFKDSIKAGAELKANLRSLDSGVDINVVVFAWPSDGSCMPYLAYANDRQDAAPSGVALARAFLKLAEFLIRTEVRNECNQKIHFLAHSMGNYVLRHAVQEIKKHYLHRPPRIFDQIFMMAADEDDDTFEHDYKLALLPKMAHRVNVYFNREDVALQISDKSKGNPDRLGTDGPRVASKLPTKISQIDCTEVVKGLVEHSYYKDSERVMEDMIQVIKGVQSSDISDRSFIQETNKYCLV